MPPQIKVPRQDIIEAAIALVREQGVGALCARGVAARLGCSTQPVFSNFPTMEDLRRAVIAQAVTIHDVHTRRVMESGQYPPYKATGMAYIGFAQQEPELFRLLYMQNRGEDAVPARTDFDGAVLELAQNASGIPSEDTRLFHMEMWTFVHGIAVMVATGFLRPDEQLISRMITDTFQGLRRNLYERHHTNNATE